MIYSFYIEDAEKYGVNEAIFLYNLKYWLNKNKANEEHFYDGRTWTYNSRRAFVELFPFWSPDQIKRIIKKLLDKGVLVKGDYNKSPYDRTSWYALEDESNLLDWTKSPNLLAESTQPIPDNKPNNKNIYTRKTNLPKDFAISDEVRKYARKNGYDRLEERLEHFRLSAESNGYKYVNWDAAFKKAIRDDWAKLGGKKTDDNFTGVISI